MASSLEFNKTLAAILTAGIVASGSGVLSRILYHPTVPEEPAYPIEVAATEAGAAEEGGEPEPDIGTLLAAADLGAGETEARKCASCHTFEKGGANKIGPALWGVVGRDVGAAPDFAYSPAMAEHGGSWDYQHLSDFLANPKGAVPGTKMAFAGIRDPADRANVILYLHSLADQPLPLPEAGSAVEPPADAAADTAAAEPGAAAAPAEEGAAAPAEPAPADQAAAEAAAPVQEPAAAEPPAAAPEPAPAATPQAAAPAAPAAAAGGDQLAALLAGSDVAAGEKAARKCKACHAFDKGGANKIGPALWGVVGRPVGGAEGFAYSPAMAGHGGSWDYESLDAFLANPKGYVPGTKMAFVGVKKEDERAAVILYLRSLADEPAPLPAKG
jgi:cytochrome c2